MKNSETIEFANAKVNLALHVLGRRRDGYHLLDSLVVFPSIADKLEIRESKRFSLTVVGEFSKLIDLENNSIIKAIMLIKEQLPSEFSIHLEKNIPVGAGLGGGSADSAAVIRYFYKNYKIRMPANEIISQIGADVPVCISSKFQRVKGIGEVVSKISNPNLEVWIVLVNPRIYVSTSRIFECLQTLNNRALENFGTFKNSKELIKYLLRQRNDLEAVASENHPEINEVLIEIKKTKNNLLSRMTGSGSTCFGLYLKWEDAEHAKAYLSKNFNNWWVKHARIF